MPAGETARCHGALLVPHILQPDCHLRDLRRGGAAMVGGGEENAKISRVRPLRHIHHPAEEPVAHHRMRAEAVERANIRPNLRVAADIRAVAFTFECTSARIMAHPAGPQEFVVQRQMH